MKVLQSSVVLAACIVLSILQVALGAPQDLTKIKDEYDFIHGGPKEGSSKPPHAVNTMPVLVDQPAEVLFKADNYSTVLLGCATEKEEKDIKFSWTKNGEPFDWKALGHIAERPGEGSIMFFNPQPSDEGIYQCFAQTPLGTASTRPISLKKTFLNPPKIESKEHNPVSGRPFKLECSIPESYPKPTIVWKKQKGGDLKNAEEFLDRRITLSPDGNLWFSNVTEKDVSPEVKYICLAQNPAVKNEVVLAEHVLKTLVEDKEPNNGELVPQYLSNDMVALHGNVTMLYCIYGGTPLGFPDWYKDDKLIESKHTDRVTDHNRTSGKRLLFKTTLPEDEATYTCKVNNKVGKPVSHSMKLTVVSAPKFTQELVKQLDVKESSDVEVPCKVSGLPAPKVTLTYNGKPAENLTYKDGVVSLPKITKGNTGYYGCKAENEHGLIYAETLVNVV